MLPLAANAVGSVLDCGGLRHDRGGDRLWSSWLLLAMTRAMIPPAMAPPMIGDRSAQFAHVSLGVLCVKEVRFLQAYETTVR